MPDNSLCIEALLEGSTYCREYRFYDLLLSNYAIPLHLLASVSPVIGCILLR